MFFFHLSLFYQLVVSLSHDAGLVQSVSNGQYGGDKILMADEAFEQFILKQMEEWHVPGLAVAIVEGNKTWSRGFGHSTIDSRVVTPSTLFYCGSMTKSMTAAALSLLVESPGNHSLKWTSPVSSLLGANFVLSDPWATAHITIEDALSHRTGYPRHDFSGPFVSKQDLIRAFKSLPMTEEPRVKWQYSNMMYGLLGYVIEHVSKTALAEFFRDRLWHPMDMKSTFLGPKDALESGNDLARPYYYNNDTKTYGVLPWNDEGSVAGAGMAISSVLDWSRYLRHMIGETGPISKAGHAALKVPHMVSEQDRRIYSGTELYGFGWASNIIQNEEAWYHSGRVSGMLSYMAFVPSRKFGFVVMLNTESVAALDTIFSTILFNYFNVPQINRNDIPGGWYDLLRDNDAKLQNCSARLFPPSKEELVPRGINFDTLVGSYYDEGYGWANITTQCEEKGTAENGSPASPSRTTNGCILVIHRAEIFGKRISFQLEHVSKENWLAWLFVDDYATSKRPTGCYRAQIRRSNLGRPDAIGLDMQMNGDDKPLIWFERKQ